MLLMKFDYDQPADLRDIHVESVDRRMDRWTDGRPLDSHPISSTWAFGSGELKISRHIV